jgi:hypothetical protein
MIEYLRTDNSPLNISYTASAYATNVYFEVYDLDTEEFVQGGKASSGASSVYTLTLNADSTQYDRKLKIEYVTTSGSGAYNEIQFASLIRPYASPTRIRELATIEDSVTDDQLRKLERRARLTINSYLGFNFNKEKRTITVYGNNTDILSLPEKIYRIDSIYEDDLLVYERGNSTYQFDFPIEISGSGNRIKTVNSSAENKETLEFPKFSVFHYDGIFKKDYAYKIDGVWGGDYIPSEIEESTSLLVEDYLCNDFNIRNKNIAELSNDSYDIKYGKDFATGTGNLIVDNLLSIYKQPRYLVI